MYADIKMFITYLYPLSLCLLTLLIGMIFLWMSKRIQIGKIAITVGLFILVLFSLPFFPDLLLGHLEQRFTGFTKDSNQKEKFLNVTYVVVLAGGHTLDPRVPITSQFRHQGLVRLIEGIRLYYKCSKAKLILSGGLGRDPVSDAELMADLAIELGVAKEDIILESKSISTFEESLFIKPIVKNERFLLVTSASHMPRAMALFRKLGMNPIPAPTGHLVKHYGSKVSVMPGALDLLKSEIMLYEYLGLIKEKLLGRI